MNGGGGSDLAGDGAPVAGDERGRAAGLPLTTAHLNAAAASGDDDGDGCATSPEMAGGNRRRLELEDEQ
uniref:DUF834 domain-containing protein n=1 Tax=Oryza sativa subsp. japonica TaxID=39947 RepID=Q69KR0_ORYSJ|nr:hypothetical protein [Oryza sativa Japonica Group]BAD31881.1 hypothetical protein [Oryza sativa Japonica Group]